MEDPDPLPSATSPTGGTNKVEFLIQYDGYAHETTWEISQNGQVIYSFPQDSPNPENIGDNELWSYVFDEFPTGEFTFTILDERFDGLSATDTSPKNGFYIIHNVVDDCNKDILAVGDHSFGRSKSSLFQVQSPNGLSAPALTKQRASRPGVQHSVEILPGNNQ